MTALKNEDWQTDTGFEEAMDDFSHRVLAEMERLDQNAAASDSHIPFEAAISYFEGGELFKSYSEHVEGCDYCRELLSVMHPSDQARSDFATAVRWAVESARHKPVGVRHDWIGKLKSSFRKGDPITT